MKTDTIEIKKLTPSEGMYLTNGETIAEGVVYLGKNDNEENWREITAEEKEKIEAEQKIEMEAEEKEKMTELEVDQKEIDNI